MIIQETYDKTWQVDYRGRPIIRILSLLAKVDTGGL